MRLFLRHGWCLVRKHIVTLSANPRRTILIMLMGEVLPLTPIRPTRTMSIRMFPHTPTILTATHIAILIHKLTDMVKTTATTATPKTKTER